MSENKKSKPLVVITTIEGKRHATMKSGMSVVKYSAAKAAMVSKGTKVGKSRLA